MQIRFVVDPVDPGSRLGSTAIVSVLRRFRPFVVAFKPKKAIDSPHILWGKQCPQKQNQRVLRVGLGLGGGGGDAIIYCKRPFHGRIPKFYSNVLRINGEKKGGKNDVNLHDQKLQYCSQSKPQLHIAIMNWGGMGNQEHTHNPIPYVEKKNGKPRNFHGLDQSSQSEQNDNKKKKKRRRWKNCSTVIP